MVEFKDYRFNLSTVNTWVFQEIFEK